MHIAIASHYRLPAHGYGGTERVVVSLARGLAALGHRVTLLAAPGTRVPEATVIEVPRRVLRPADLATLAPADADIVHSHIGLAQPLPRPFVQTLHGHLRPGQMPGPNTICLSRRHAEPYRSNVFVYNGLDPADYVFRSTKGDYDLFLGRLHRAKGFAWAIEGARRTGRRLVLAGGWRPSLRRGITFVGSVDGREKAELLAGARCLWMPAQWEEPFGLVTIEALFSGTPVLCTRRGALPEIVTPEVGSLGDTLEDLIAALETIGTRSPEACRAHAERYFTHSVMAAEYVRMYRAVLEAGALPPGRATPDAPPPSGAPR